MSYQATVFRVFIASPSDVDDERQIIRDALDRWNTLHSKDKKIVLLPVGWETHSYPVSGDSPQQTLNKQILHDADLLIGVFWARLGTPTDKYPSGSVEEYYEHIQNEKPAMLYFSTKPIPHGHDQEQFRLLKEFKTSINNALYGVYSDNQDFQKKIFDKITLMINDHEYFEIDDEQLTMLKPGLELSSQQSSEEPLSDLAKEKFICAARNTITIINKLNSGG